MTREKCSRCWNAFYCNINCQRNHWGSHKDRCPALAKRECDIQFSLIGKNFLELKKNDEELSELLDHINPILNQRLRGTKAFIRQYAQMQTDIPLEALQKGVDYLSLIDQFLEMNERAIKLARNVKGKIQEVKAQFKFLQRTVPYEEVKMYLDKAEEALPERNPHMEELLSVGSAEMRVLRSQMHSILEPSAKKALAFVAMVGAVYQLFQGFKAHKN